MIQVHALPFHALTRVPQVYELAILDMPWPFSRAETTADPAGHTPDPPARHLGIVERRITLKPSLKRFLPLDEPDVPGMQVVLIHRPVGMESDRLGIILQGTPKVADEAIDIVHSLSARPSIGPRQQHCARAEEWLDVIPNRAEAWPDQSSGSALATEVRERSFERHSPTSVFSGPYRSMAA